MIVQSVMSTAMNWMARGSGYAAPTQPTVGGRHIGKVSPHIGKLTVHIAKVSQHFAKWTLHFGKWTPHIGKLTLHFAKLTAHFAKVSPHFAKWTLHFAKVSSHFAKLTRHFANGSPHFANSVGRVSPQGVTRHMAPVLSVAGMASGYAALTRIWTPPVLPARMLDDKGVDCSRISGLLVGRSGPGHDELSARLLLIDLACSRHIGFGRVFRRRFDRFVIGDSCWAIVRKVLLLKLSS